MVCSLRSCRPRARLWAGLGAGCLACAVAMLAWHAQAQQLRPRSPQIGYVYPAGGRQGTEVDVVVGGQALLGVVGATVTGDGVTATVGPYDRPMTQREVQQLRDKIEETRTKLRQEGPLLRRAGRGGLLEIAREAGISETQIRKLMEFQRARTDPKRQPNPQIEEKVTLRITIAADAMPGTRELRLATPSGLSNPLRFRVGRLPEFTESEPNDTSPDTSLGNALPAVMNGQILPGDVDRFAFDAAKGSRLVVAIAARALIPYLADAVPGWFQPTATIYDSEGREVAYADDYRFDPDPVLCYTIPSSGRYVLAIKDSIYRGREDFVYRITIGALPFVTGFFPMGCAAGRTTTVALSGWNLPVRSVTFDASQKGPGLCPVLSDEQAINAESITVAVDDMPHTSEYEPNDRVGDAQPVESGTVVNGRVARPGDTDMYRLQGRAGTEMVAEVMARRLGSPLDSVVVITDASGKRIAASDDCEDRRSALLTHHADSYVRVVVPKTGTYYVRVGDSQGKGGSEYGYRIRVSRPRPDFALRVTPSSVSIRAGAQAAATVYALRQDGFDGAIDLRLVDGPRGAALSGGRIPAGQDRVAVTLSAPMVRAAGDVNLGLEGTATIGGTEVRRRAVPCEDMMQAFAYRHLVPVKEWVARIGGRVGLGPSLRVSSDGTPLRIPVGGTVEVRVAAPAWLLAEEVVFELDDAPAGIRAGQTRRLGNALGLTLSADAPKAKVGDRGNLLLVAYRETTAAGANGKRTTRRIPLGLLPATPYEVVRR